MTDMFQANPQNAMVLRSGDQRYHWLTLKDHTGRLYEPMTEEQIQNRVREAGFDFIIGYPSASAQQEGFQ
jgi:hypothetical protein